MATKRAEPAEKAAPTKATKATKAVKAQKAPKAAASDDAEKQGRRSFGSRGWLAVEVDKYLRQNPDTTISVGQIVKAVTNSAGEHPSTGAVAACVTRWNEQGYVKVNKTRPLSFTGFTAKWKTSTLDDFLEAEKAKRAKTRAAAKAA